MAKYNHRISILLDDSLYERARDIPWGLRNAMMREILKRVLDAGDKHGEMVYGAIIGGSFNIEYVLKEGSQDEA